MDKAIDGSIKVGKQAFSILKQVVAQFKNRTYDDLGYFSRNMIITGAAVGGASLVILIAGAIAKLGFITGQTVIPTSLVSGILVCGIGMVSMGQAAIAIENSQDDDSRVEQMPDVQQEVQDDASQDYEDNLGDELSDLFGDDDTETFDTVDGTGDLEDEPEDPYNWGNNGGDEDPVEEIPEAQSPEEALSNVKENQILSRHNLIENMLPFFPKNTPDFADMREIDAQSEQFQTLETVTVKAIANVMQTEIEDVPTRLEKAEEGLFSYRLRFKRINSLNTDSKKQALADEFVNYIRENPKDYTIQAEVELDGDFFVVTVNKGATKVVTIGDVLQNRDNREFFEDEKHKIPLIVGLDDIGQVILDDAKPFDTMMICGKPRSGKSWYVFNILLSMMAFNSPEDVQFVIVDPKKANLFFKLQLLPHVIGIHDDKNILEIMDDIIENEGERRKKLLMNNECDDIWGLRKKGIKLPILYLVIDEVITVTNNLKNKDPKLEKEFNQKLQVLISELPYVGIRLIFVPHRATGIVNKTNRTLLQFITAVRADKDVVEEALGVTKWTRQLTMPGDMAVQVQTRRDPFYARGPAIATSDEETAKIMVGIAKAYYKLGVEESDLKKTLTIAYNRNEDEIRQKLRGDIIQYDASRVLNDDDLDSGRYSQDNQRDNQQRNIQGQQSENNDEDLEFDTEFNGQSDNRESQTNQVDNEYDQQVGRYDIQEPVRRQQPAREQQPAPRQLGRMMSNAGYSRPVASQTVNRSTNNGNNGNDHWTSSTSDDVFDIDAEIPDELDFDTDDEIDIQDV